jgi:hypothetical protein
MIRRNKSYAKHYKVKIEDQKVFITDKMFSNELFKLLLNRMQSTGFNVYRYTQLNNEAVIMTYWKKLKYCKRFKSIYVTPIKKKTKIDKSKLLN